MKLLRIDTSARVAGSTSRRLADIAEAYLRRRSDMTVTRRDLGRHPLPAVEDAESDAGTGEDGETTTTEADTTPA